MVLVSLPRHGLCFLKDSFWGGVVISHKYPLTLQMTTCCRSISHSVLFLFFFFSPVVLENSDDTFLPYMYLDTSAYHPDPFTLSS